MVRLLILTAAFSLFPIKGIWVKSDGTKIEMICPEDFSKSKVRLPKNCVAREAGVWISREWFIKTSGEISALKAEISELEKIKDYQKEAYANLKLTCMLQGSQICSQCSCPKWGYVFEGTLIGSATTLGGCILYNTFK